MSDRATLGALLQALAQTRPDATVSDFDQAARPEAYAVPMDRRPATLRAPTYGERLMDVVQRLAQPVAEQPVGRLLDILLSGGGIRAIADGQSPPLVSMGEAQRKRVPNPIKAYHGSPHDFDQFSMEKIGTGEGAQAYGHGLYFAEAEPTAKTYRDVLARPELRVGGGPNAGKRISPHPGSPEEIALAHVEDAAASGAMYPFEKAKDGIAKAMQVAAPDQRHRFEAASQAVDVWQRHGAKIDKGGKMYEVNIHADPESFLDWDKPLSQQPEAVRNALTSKVNLPNMDVSGRDIMQEWARPRSYAVKDDSGRWVKSPARTADEAAAMVGGDRSRIRGKDDPTPQAVASNLRDMGINGVKYQDQLTRDRKAAAGTSNYVVFDDSLIEILRKYGLLPFAAGLGAAGKDQR